MKIVRTIAEVRAAVADARAEGRSVGVVPTMGAFHDGHLALIRAARERCDLVVVSLFVNPAQFNDHGDLAAYPRNERRDATLAEDEGADLLWAPAADTVYPPGFATTVSVAGPARPLEGEHRGTTHFDGVATVVLKLFNVIQPDVAFFGQKDAQQVAVIRRMVADLDVPVRLSIEPTVREPDGLALSSRNVRLRGEDRARATALYEALEAARRAVDGGELSAAGVRAAALAAMRRRSVEPEYLELVDPTTFAQVDHVNGAVLVAVAAQVGSARLIDNVLLSSPTATTGGA